MCVGGSSSSSYSNTLVGYLDLVQDTIGACISSLPFCGDLVDFFFFVDRIPWHDYVM